MSALRLLLVACSLSLCVLTQAAAPAHAGQADGDADDGLIRSGLILNGRSISVAYDPALPSDHRSLLVLRAGSTQAAVRLGRIEGHRSLAIGTLAPDAENPPRRGPDHDLWLMRTAAGWVLDARPVEEPADTDDGEGTGDEAGGGADGDVDADAAGPDDAPANAAGPGAGTDNDSADADAPGAEAEAEDAAADEEAEDAAADEEAEGRQADEATDTEGENADADGEDTDVEAADAEAEGDDADADSEDAPPSPRPGRIPLAHRPLGDEVDTLAVRLLPAADEAGTLELVWGRNRWTADFEFVELPRRPRPPRTSNVSPGTSLTRDSDLEARYRAAALGSRNETALRTPDGASIQVLFEQELGTDGVDFAALESIGDGDLVELTEGAVIRLRSEVPLRFGDTLIPTDNLAPDFPGSYGLWLRASGPGWTLVFNNEPDSWGTQHDPAFDAAEVDIDHTHGGPYEERPLGVSLVPVGDDEGRLVIVWGQHVWAADFTIEPQESAP